MTSSNPSPKLSTEQRLLPKLIDFVKLRYFAVDPRWLGIFRILLGTLLCVDLLRRFPVVRAFYSNDGLLPNHFSLFRPMGPNLFSVYHAFSTPGEVRFAFALTLVVFLLFTIGYKTKLFHVLSAILITSLNARNVFAENGGDTVVNLLVLWSLFLPLNARFSLDSVLRSLRTEKESNATELNARDSLQSSVRPIFGLAVFGIIVQWSVIYLSNGIRKDGLGWRNGSAVHYFWHQDRIVTGLGLWAREHVPYELSRILTHSVLWIEIALGVLLLIPLFQTSLRRLALAFALILHGGIAATTRLGMFSYVMPLPFIMLLGASEFQWLTRHLGASKRQRVVIYDGDCGVCLLVARVLKRFDPFQRLEFLENHNVSERFATLDPELCSRSVVVVDPKGRFHSHEDALFEVARALPFGILSAPLFKLPGLRQASRFLYERFAQHRHQVSAWLGLGVCEVAGRDAAPPKTDAPAAKRAVASVPPYRKTREQAFTVGREILAGLFVIACFTKIANDNDWLRLQQYVKQPRWAWDFVHYARLWQNWRMFAPDPPYEDGHLVVDGRTVDGRKLDPLQGGPPDFDPYTRAGWGLDQFWCDYQNMIRFPDNKGRRQFLRDYLLRLHEFSGRPQDRLVAFDVWWVQDRSPEPGNLRGEPLPPVRLLNYGRVTDSGAEPWLPDPVPDVRVQR